MKIKRFPEGGSVYRSNNNGIGGKYKVGFWNFAPSKGKPGTVYLAERELWAKRVATYILSDVGKEIAFNIKKSKNVIIGTIIESNGLIAVIQKRDGDLIIVTKKSVRRSSLRYTNYYQQNKIKKKLRWRGHEYERKLQQKRNAGGD